MAAALTSRVSPTLNNVSAAARSSTTGVVTLDDAEEEEAKKASSHNPLTNDDDHDMMDGQFILPDSVIVEFEADDEATEPQIKEAAARRERSISASPPLCPQSRYLLWSCVRSDSEAEPSPVLNYRRDPDRSPASAAAGGAYQVPPPWLASSSGNAAAREAVALLKAKQKSRSRQAADKACQSTAPDEGGADENNVNVTNDIQNSTSEIHHASATALKSRRRRRGRLVQQGTEAEPETPQEAGEKENLVEEAKRKAKLDEETKTTPEVKEVDLAAADNDATADVAAPEEEVVEGTPLFDTFTIWFDPGAHGGACNPTGPRDSEEYTRGLVRLGDVNTVEGFWRFWNSIDLMKLPKYSTISVFKNGIQPAWEDESNQEGGRWVVKGLCRSDSKEYYSTCVLALLGNLFTAPQKMNGIVLSVRPRGNTIALWNSIVDPELFEVIDWELRSIAPEDMQETVEVEYRDHRGAINHNMRKLGSGASHWRLCTGMENAAGSMMMAPGTWTLDTPETWTPDGVCDLSCAEAQQTYLCCPGVDESAPFNGFWEDYYSNVYSTAAE
ncbi:hypothetical protein FOZ63_021265 [Perkinsus olseni]|uniref:Eukaryotic translation initiation factor 4E n=1 Tax=Perkinsus olseni TaxID=32597 RepID=A0A7J6RHJ5_PEROL|nr:hypothetical protein FOZ63_021265 [Perkinsus olseni]